MEDTAEKVVEDLKNEEKLKKSSKKTTKKRKFFKKKSNFNEEEYFINLIKEERKKRPEINPLELSNKLGISREKVKKLIEKMNKVEEKPKKTTKKLKKNRLKDLLDYLKQKKILDKEDKSVLRDFFAFSAIFGLIINLGLYSINLLQFTWYSWFGVGVLYWMFENKFISQLRRLWFRNA